MIFSLSSKVRSSFPYRMRSIFMSFLIFSSLAVADKFIVLACLDVTDAYNFVVSVLFALLKPSGNVFTFDLGIISFNHLTSLERLDKSISFWLFRIELNLSLVVSQYLYILIFCNEI